MRAGQVHTLLVGDQFWYLGSVYANRLAPWLALVVLIIGLARDWRLLALPLALLGMAVGASLFTVSDLFITHYALLQPLVLAIAGLAMAGGLGLPSHAGGAARRDRRARRIARRSASASC